MMGTPVAPAYFNVTSVATLAACGTCGQVILAGRHGAHTADHAERDRQAARLAQLEKLVDPLRCVSCGQPCHQVEGRWLADVDDPLMPAGYCPGRADGHLVQP